jgi:hypothetical protein
LSHGYPSIFESSASSSDKFGERRLWKYMMACMVWR